MTLHEQRFAEAKKNFKKINLVYPYMCDSEEDCCQNDNRIRRRTWLLNCVGKAINVLIDENFLDPPITWP